MTKNRLIPTTTEYAIRAMAQLAIVGKEHSIRAEELSKTTSIPKDYLSKVLRKLVEYGLLKAEKGHGGGFSLALSADQISFQDIFEAMGFEFAIDHCAFGWEACSSRSPCPLHESYSVLKMNFHTWASSTTLDTIDDSQTMLRRLERLAVK